VLGVAPQEPADIRCGDPGFADASEGFDNATARAVLQVGSDVVLDSSRRGKAELLPDVVDKITEVLERMRLAQWVESDAGSKGNSLSF
jgi:hypothetical protein